MFRLWTILSTCLVSVVVADYTCVCNYNVEKSVFDHPNNHGNALGYMYEFDCKPKADAGGNGKFLPIMFEHQLGYVEKDAQVEEQTCPGSIPPDDLLTTVVHHTTTTVTTTTSTTPAPTTTTTTTPKPTTTTTTTPKPTTTTTTTPKPTTTTTTTPKPTTTTTTTPKPTTITTTTPKPTATTTTPKQTTDQYTIPEGHLELCSDKIKGDLNIFDGFMGQFGEFCYEFVNVTTQWHNADRHCHIAGGGTLIHVLNKEEQNFFLRFMINNQASKDTIWLGLTDSTTEGATAEGSWQWSSGANISYTNWGSDYNGHSTYTHGLDDCAVMLPGGEWTDKPCGVALIAGTGFGEQHKFICQYNVTSKPPSLFEVFPHAIFG